MRTLYQLALDNLAQSCKVLSSSDPEDVKLMSTATFTLFNQEIIKIPQSSSTYRHVIEDLCTYFLVAFNHLETLRTESISEETSTSTPSTNISLTESRSREQIDILRALSATLFENGASAKESLPELFRIISNIAGGSFKQGQSEQRRMALNCLANLVHNTGSLFSTLHERMYGILLSNLTATSHSALRALHFLLQEDKYVATRSLGPILDVIFRFMFFSSENTSSSSLHGSNLGALSVGVIKRSSYATLSGTIPTTKVSGVTNTSTNNSPHSSVSQSDILIPQRDLQSSDSEYSDSESGASQAQRRQHDGKVRLNALLCLQSIARTAPKQLQPHWPKFLTTSSFPPMWAGIRKAPSLMSLAGSDPILTVRSSACVVLGNIFETSKQYLAMAEEKPTLPGNRSQTGILTLSERIGLMSKELHIGMAAALEGLDSSTDQGAIIQMIKCCSIVVASSSYEKMGPSLCLVLYNPIKKYLIGSEPALQTSALSFVSALLSNSSAQAGVKECILPPAVNNSGSQGAGLLSVLLNFVEGESIPAKVEAWATLRAVSQFHFESVRGIWSRLDEAMKVTGDQGDARVWSAALLFLEEYAKAGSNSLEPLSIDWWSDALEVHIMKTFAEDTPVMKTLGCDFISLLSSNSFNSLPSRMQVLIMSVVLGTSQDENGGARAAACRTIGVFILFPSQWEESTHLVDMANTVLDLCRDPNLAVRVRASWAVGNLCDALVLMKTGGHDQVLQEILTLTMWTKVMRTALFISQDHEKLKSNGIRAIGGLLRVSFEGILDRERHSLVKDAVQTLIKHMEQGSLKGRWNACYAMQNVLLNPDFPIGSTFGTTYALDSDLVSWTLDVYGALMQAIQHSRNFKVRINACAALTVPKTRAKYGDQALFRRIVKVVISSVENLDAEQGEHEFGEFQYRDQLEMKLLRCLDHLLQLSGGVASLDLELDPALRHRIVASRPATTTMTTADGASGSAEREQLQAVHAGSPTLSSSG
ncbi:HEAT repeat-containing protein 6 [Gryganskiella cystojenkinii]|nr:HEAT repeat-containing protein 6 [Gryganskiella cystojenkinii]